MNLILVFFKRYILPGLVFGLGFGLIEFLFYGIFKGIFAFIFCGVFFGLALSIYRVIQINKSKQIKNEILEKNIVIFDGPVDFYKGWLFLTDNSIILKHYKFEATVFFDSIQKIKKYSRFFAPNGLIITSNDKTYKFIMENRRKFIALLEEKGIKTDN